MRLCTRVAGRCTAAFKQQDRIGGRLRIHVYLKYSSTAVLEYYILIIMRTKI
jgi:hypothetical protein